MILSYGSFPLTLTINKLTQLFTDNLTWASSYTYIIVILIKVEAVDMKISSGQSNKNLRYLTRPEIRQPGPNKSYNYVSF